MEAAERSIQQAQAFNKLLKEKMSLAASQPGFQVPDEATMCDIELEHREHIRWIMSLLRLQHGAGVSERVDFLELYQAKDKMRFNTVCETLARQLAAPENSKLEATIFRLPDGLIALLPTLINFYISRKTPFVFLLKKKKKN